MLYKTLSYILFISNILAYNAYAIDPASLDIREGGNDMINCTPSKESLDNYEPAIFPKTNNLLTKQGMPEEFFGQKILLQGVLVDTNCVPISDAKIHLWQMADRGKFPYKFLRRSTPEKMSYINEYDSFLGAGTAITDNHGKFHFITIMPSNKKYPFVNFRVSHRDFNDFQTQQDIHETWDDAYEEAFAYDQDNRRYKNYKIMYIKLVAPFVNKTRRY